VLVHPEDIELVRMAFQRLNYRETATPWTFRNTNLTLHRFLKTAGEEEMMVDILLANTPDHQQIITRAVQSGAEVGPVRVAAKDDLILLKSARNSDQDRVDIKGLQDDSHREGSEDGQ
jgi:ribosomal protein S28E/S33